MIWKKFHVKRRDNLPFVGWAGNRAMLAELFGEAGLHAGAEIGVRKGAYSQVLLKSNPKLQLTCVDPWMPYDRVNLKRQEGYYSIFQRDTAKHKDRIRVIRQTSMDALHEVADGSLDFVYIDGAHDFDNVVRDIIGWSSKVRSGGIISGHDYYCFYQSGVVLAVDAYTRAHNIQNWYLTREITREEPPSWLWVNP